jgi:hypothetical protein
MKMSKFAALIPVCCLVFAGTGGTAFAQLGGNNASAAYWAGRTPNPTKTCPGISYHFRGMSATPTGYVWFNDGSGMSKATGTADLKTGAFHLTVTSIDGNGPTGEVNGIKDPKTGAVTAELKGPGCSNLKLVPMKPIYVEHDNGQG